MHFLSNLSGVLLDRLHILRRDVYGRDDASGVTGVNAGQLDMLHHCWNKRMGAVADGIRLALQGMIQEPVDKDRSVRGNAHCSLHISYHALIIIDHFHTPTAEYIGRTYHYRITDLCCDCQSILDGNRHSGLRHGNLQLVHHCAEQVSVLCKIDHCRRRTENFDTVLFQRSCQIQRCLSAELSDHTQRLLLLVNAQNILQCQRQSAVSINIRTRPINFLNRMFIQYMHCCFICIMHRIQIPRIHNKTSVNTDNHLHPAVRIDGLMMLDKFH